MTDAAGARVGQPIKYDPFGTRRSGTNLGQTLSAAPQSDVLDGFTGHRHDDEFGLIHMRGRAFDPALGRFLSADPMVQFPSIGQSWNRYSYVRNNPLSARDPSGFDETDGEISGYYDWGGGGDSGFSSWGGYVDSSSGGGVPSGGWSLSAAPSNSSGVPSGIGGRVDNFGPSPSDAGLFSSTAGAVATQFIGGVVLGFPFGGIPGASLFLRPPDVVKQRPVVRLGFGFGELLGGLNSAWTGLETTAGGAEVAIGGSALAPETYGASMGVAAAGVTVSIVGVAVTVGSVVNAVQGLSMMADSGGLKWGNKKSVPTYGHTFSEHGFQRTKGLIGEAGGTGKPQGQWLDNQAAADFLAAQRPNIFEPTIVDIPEGLGRVIMPDGSAVPASQAMLVPKESGGYITAFPILPAE